MYVCVCVCVKADNSLIQERALTRGQTPIGGWTLVDKGSHSSVFSSCLQLSVVADGYLQLPV